MKVRTRFAPSPTGFLHVGGARTALFNWLLARRHGGVFVLRVEDTDAARNTAEACEAVYRGMRWLGLDWDEGPEFEGLGGGEFGPYFQSRRHAIYEKWFGKLVAAGRVYEDDGAWRFRFERKPVTMHDAVCGEVTVDYRDESNTPDMVVRRSDGSFVFHFVNVVDDIEMGMTHVIRGEDHLMNTPKHLQLFEAFGETPPVYAHMPLTLNQDGSKMSKRDVGARVGDYAPQGYLSAALVNYLALLGWSPGDDTEVMTPEEVAGRFSIEGINRAPGRFDTEKCAWLNQQHLAMLGDDEFAAAARPFVEAAGIPIDDRYPEAARAVREKVRLLSEVPKHLDFLYAAEIEIEPEALAKLKGNADAPALLAALADAFEALTDDWSGETAKAAIGETAKARGVKPGKLMFPTRVALSGRTAGPDLAAILSILGREESARRVRGCVEALKG
jgi:glutamyl-tRNA synthetase